MNFDSVIHVTADIGDLRLRRQMFTGKMIVQVRYNRVRKTTRPDGTVTLEPAGLTAWEDLSSHPEAIAEVTNIFDARRRFKDLLTPISRAFRSNT